MKIPQLERCGATLCLFAILSVFTPAALPAFPTNSATFEDLEKDFENALKLLKKRKHEQAEALLRNIIAADSLFQEPSGRSAWGPLGLALIEQNLIGESMQLLEKGYRLFFTAGKNEPYLAYQLAHLFAQYQRDERKLEITSLYYDALEHMQPQRQPDLWETLYAQTEFLLSESERNAVEKSLAEQNPPGSILMNYFQTNDLAPLTAENEFLIAYLQRIAEARRKYADESAPSGFDDRGKIYVRFGKPDRVVTDRSGELGQVGWKMHPYEVWFYKRLDADMYFTFVGKSDNRDYRWVDGPESIFGRFYSGRRTMFERKVARTGESAMALRDELYTSLAPWHETFRERLYRLSTMQSLREAADYASLYFQQEDRAHTQKIAENAPAIILDSAGDANLLPIAFSHAAFRENEQIDRLEIYYSVPYETLYFEEATNGYKAQIRRRIAIFDENFQPVLRDSSTQMLFEKKARETRRGNFLSQFNVRLPAGTYHAVLQVEDLYGNRKGFVRFPLQLQKFAPNRLAISDIQLSPRIQETREKFEFAKHGVLVTPLPSRMLSKDKPLFLYYEIYHLSRNANGETKYKVEYKLRTAVLPDNAKKQHAITLSEQRAANSSHQAEYLAMDASRFQAGDATLEIYVTDLLNNTVAFSEVRVTLEK